MDTEKEDGDTQPPRGIWKIGVLLEASFHEQLRECPMKLLKCVADKSESGSETIALCKQNTLSTYDYVNDYTAPPPRTGCLLHAGDESKCKYPAVIIASVSQGVTDYEKLCADIQIPGKELEISAGLPCTHTPQLLLASQHFMQTYGFYTQEQVWYRQIAPVTLERVTLTPFGTSEKTVMAFPEEVVGQLYQQCNHEPVVMQQGFDYVIRAKLPHTLSTSAQTASDNPDERIDYVLTVRVLEATPTLQGVVRETTTIVLLPPNEQDLGSDWLNRSNGSRSSRRRSTREEALAVRRGSAASASDIMFDDEAIYGSYTTNREFEDYIIDVVAVSDFKLQSHCVVLPKQSALAHAVFHCQPVWACAVDRRAVDMVTTFEDLTLTLANGEWGDERADPRMHTALVFVYEDEFELEQYVPPNRLGVEYETADLTRAYIHPELLFYLYPETLSYSRTYQLQIKLCRDPVPTLREMKVAQVYNPEETSSNSVDLLYRTLRKQSLFLSIGDVISVKADSGKLYYKVTSLEPQTQNSSHINSSNAWECSFYPPHKLYNHIPDLVPPSFSDRPPFFSDIQPPGLEEFCDTLFSYFIPAFTEKSSFSAPSSTRPRRSPSVLVTGPRGVGKRTVIKAVARRCRMNVVELNCFEFSTDVAASSEKRITVDLDNASTNAPVVILLRNVHMMGMRDPIHQEPRLMAMFEIYMKHVDQFNRTHQYPIFVVGVSSHPQAIPARIQACFLHQLDLTTPTLSQRMSMLEGLAREYHLGPDIDLQELSKRTAGFSLGDMLALYSNAQRLAYQSVIKNCGGCHMHGADLAVSGVVISSNHLEDALNTLHSSHADAIGAPKIPNVKWEDVGGLGDAKKEILDTIQLPLLHPELFSTKVQRSGVLLYGPPGTGKTLLAKAVATECSLNFLSVKGPELINMYVGQSEENIREVFSRASQAAPSVIFFDELDSIAPNRGRSGDSGGVMDRVVSQLLAELDGLSKSENVFVIGASNRPDLIDPALLRPGRFDRLVYLGISENTDSKLKILKAITRKFNLSAEVNLEEIADKCPSNLTGADLYSLCSDAMLIALRKQIDELEKQHKSDDEWEGVLMVSQEDFMESLEQLSPSVSAEELTRYKDIKNSLRT